MSSSLRIACLVALGVSLPGCTTDVVVGRYASASCQAEDANAQPCHNAVAAADVAIVTIKTPASASSAPAPLTSPTNFPERALAEYIRAVSSPTLTEDQRKVLISALATSIKPPPEANPLDDRTLLHRTLIATVSKKAPFNPADRLEATDVFIEPVDAKFESWDVAATLQTTINAGTVQLSQVRNNETDITVTPGPAAALLSPIGGNLTNKFTAGETRVENLNATRQADGLTVSVKPNGSMRIHREGGFGVDLTGNTIVKTDLRLASRRSSIKTLFSVDGDYLDDKGNWAKPETFKIKAQDISTAAQNTPVTAKVTLVYTIRHVTSGDDTIEDRDDNVEEITSSTSGPVTLVPGQQVGTPMFGLLSNPPDSTQQGSGQPGAASRGFVFIERDGYPAAPFCLANYEAALQLLAYLQKGNPSAPGNFGKARLGFSIMQFDPLSPGDPQELIASAGCG